MLISENLLRNIIKNSISKKMLQKLHEKGGNPGGNLVAKEFEKSNSQTLSKSNTVGRKVGQIQTIEQIPKDGELAYVDPIVGGLVKLNIILKHMRIVEAFTEYAQYGTMALSRNSANSKEGETSVASSKNSKELLFFKNGNWTPNFTEVFTKILQQDGFTRFWSNLASSTGRGKVELKNVLLFYCYFSGVDFSNINKSIQELGQKASITFDNIGIIDRINEADAHSGAADLFIKGIQNASGDLKSFLDLAKEEVRDEASLPREKFNSKNSALGSAYKSGQSDEPRNFNKKSEEWKKSSGTQDSAYNTSKYDENFDEELSQLEKEKEDRRKFREDRDNKTTWPVGTKARKKIMNALGYDTPDDIEDAAFDDSISNLKKRRDEAKNNFRRLFMSSLFKSIGDQDTNNVNIKAVEAFIRDFVAGFSNFCRLITVFQNEFKQFGLLAFDTVLNNIKVQALLVDVVFKGYDLIVIGGVSKFINTSYYEFSVKDTQGISETIKEKFKYEIKNPKKSNKKPPKKAIPVQCVTPDVQKLNSNSTIINISASLFGSSNAQVNTGDTIGKGAQGGNVSNQGTLNKINKNVNQK